MFSKSILVKGAFILTVTGFATRVLGFFYRIFLSRAFGEEAIGLYQLIFPVYALVISFTSAGLQTALSRITASKSALGKRDDSLLSLYIGLFLSFFLSVACLIATHICSDTVANVWLHDARCEELLLIASYAFPFGAIHGCICGYYIGQKQTGIPSLSLLIEQIVRIGSVFFLYRLFAGRNEYPGIILAAAGLAAGEMASAVFSICMLHRETRPAALRNNTARNTWRLSRELLSLSIPLTTNRVMLNLLQSAEALSIPLMLKSFGHSSAEALSIYGVLSGMALPCIQFSSAITNSIASMMLPTIAELQASKDGNQLIRIIKTVGCCCFVLGAGCCIFLLLFGNLIGTFVFHSALAGKFITTLAWICPFLYTNGNLLSILNGLGNANLSLSFNCVSLLIRISGTFFLIPRFGMEGYLWGLLVSQLVLFACCSFAIRRIAWPAP